MVSNGARRAAKGSSLGLHLILALPAPDELSVTHCLDLVESFIESLIAPHGLAASYALHEAHRIDETDDMDWLEAGGSKWPGTRALSSKNRHAHVLVSGRRLGPTGIDKRRFTLLDPVHGGKGGARVGIDWPGLWLQHQNAFFAHHGLDLRVRPFAKFSDGHHGSTRIGVRRTDDAGVVERASRSAVSDPSQLLELVSARPFTERDLREIVDRYAPRGRAYDLDSVDAALELPNVARPVYPVSGTSSPWYATADLTQAEQACIDLAAALLDKPYSDQASTSDLLHGPSGSLGLVDEAQAIAHVSSAIAADEDGEFSEAVHGWPSMLGAVLKIDIRRAAYHLPNAGIVLLDHADAVSALELKRLLQAVSSADDVQLLLIRRPIGLGHQRNSLLDVLAEMIDPGPAPIEHLHAARNSVRRLVDTMANEGRIVLSTHADLLKTARKLIEKKKADENILIFVCPDNEFCGLLRLDRLPDRAVAPAKGAIIVHCEPSAGNLPLLGLLESIKEPILLVNSRYCPSLSALREQIEFSRSRPCTSAMLRHQGAPPEAATVPAAKPAPSTGAKDELSGHVDELTTFGHVPGVARRPGDPVSSTEPIHEPPRSDHHPEDVRINASDSDYLADTPEDLPIERDDEAEAEPDFEREPEQEDDFNVWEDQADEPGESHDTSSDSDD